MVDYINMMHIIRKKSFWFFKKSPTIKEYNFSDDNSIEKISQLKNTIPLFFKTLEGDLYPVTNNDTIRERTKLVICLEF